MQRATEALRQVVQREQILARGDGAQPRPVRGLAEQIDADQRARAQAPSATDLANAILEMCRIYQERARVNIDEHRRGAQDHRHLGGRGIGERGQEHRIAGADAFGHQRDLDRVRAGADRDTVARATELGQRGFQLGHLGAKDELAMREHPIEPPAQFARDPGLLRPKVEKFDLRRDPPGVVHVRLTIEIAPFALCSNSGMSRPSRVSASRACPFRHAAPSSSIARPTIAGSAVRGAAISRPG